MLRLDCCCEPGNMRAGYGCARYYVKQRRFPSRKCFFCVVRAPCRKNGYTRCRYIWLQTKHATMRISASKSRSIVVAATVRIQGATFTTVPEEGPLFPAEQTTIMPFSTAWNAPMAMGSLEKSGNLACVPMDTDNTSTPSPIASSNALRMADPMHDPMASQTRYMAILDPGEPPTAVPLARP